VISLNSHLSTTTNSQATKRPSNKTTKQQTMDDFDLILQNGISFGRGGEQSKDDGKVKTKAKKKKYITGSHGSGSAMQKAKYREQRANRKKR
jgi:hypothetical protein